MKEEREGWEKERGKGREGGAMKRGKTNSVVFSFLFVFVC